MARAVRVVQVDRAAQVVPRGRPVDRSRATGRWRRLPVPGGRGASEALTVSVGLAGSAGLAVREPRASMVLPVDRVGRVLPEGPVDPAPQPVAPDVPEFREASVPRTVRAPRTAPADPAPQPVVPAAPVAA